MGHFFGVHNLQHFQAGHSIAGVLDRRHRDGEFDITSGRLVFFSGIGLESSIERIAWARLAFS